MYPFVCLPNRRNFLKVGAAFATGLSGLTLLSEHAASEDDDSGVIGPKKGFTPEVGTLTSMLAFTRMQVLHNVKGMSQQDLDFLLDTKANHHRGAASPSSRHRNLLRDEHLRWN